MIITNTFSNIILQINPCWPHFAMHLHVLFAIKAVGEVLPTELTLVGLGACMCHKMASEMCWTLERLSTKGALIWSPSHVSDHTGVQLV